MPADDDGMLPFLFNGFQILTVVPSLSNPFFDWLVRGICKPHPFL